MNHGSGLGVLGCFALRRHRAGLEDLELGVLIFFYNPIGRLGLAYSLGVLFAQSD